MPATVKIFPESLNRSNRLEMETKMAFGHQIPFQYTNKLMKTFIQFFPSGRGGKTDTEHTGRLPTVTNITCTGKELSLTFCKQELGYCFGEKSAHVYCDPSNSRLILS